MPYLRCICAPPRKRLCWFPSWFETNRLATKWRPLRWKKGAACVRHSGAPAARTPNLEIPGPGLRTLLELRDLSIQFLTFGPQEGEPPFRVKMFDTPLQ